MADAAGRGSVLETIEGMRDELVDLTLALGNIEAPSGLEGAAGDYVFDWMERNGFAPERIGVFDDRFNVVGRFHGTGGGASLSFNSHLDTIMAREDTLRFADADDPIYHKAWHENGRIYGYPVVNCKGPMACWLVAAKALKQAGIQLRGDIVLTAACGEICGDVVDEFQGHDYLANDIGTRFAITHGAISDYALVAEATNFKPAWVEAGKVYFKITVYAGPSRYTPFVRRTASLIESPNAIVRTAKLIEALEEWADDYERRHTRKYCGGTVVPKASIGAIRSGFPFKIHRFPELCLIYLDVRLNPDTSPLAVQAEIEAVAAGLQLEADVKPFLFRRGYEAHGIEPLKEAVEIAHAKVIGGATEPADPPDCSMWRDSNPYNELGIPSLCYGCGAGAGGGNTYFLVADMIKAAKVYALTALDLCNRNR